MSPETERVVITVDDKGPGIPPSEREKVFEPFYRIDNSRDPDTGGVRLGLSVTRSIIREHGGEVGLASRMGGGLSVRLELPSDPAVSPDQEEPTSGRDARKPDVLTNDSDLPSPHRTWKAREAETFFAPESLNQATRNAAWAEADSSTAPGRERLHFATSDPLSAALIVAPMVSTARRIGSASRCA